MLRALLRAHVACGLCEDGVEVCLLGQLKQLLAQYIKVKAKLRSWLESCPRLSWRCDHVLILSRIWVLSFLFLNFLKPRYLFFSCLYFLLTHSAQIGQASAEKVHMVGLRQVQDSEAVLRVLARYLLLLLFLFAALGVDHHEFSIN